VLFDLDGTLVDSFDDIRDALNALLVEAGQSPGRGVGFRHGHCCAS
jgi:phosphoglycolate phosphatase-like HAD superfamily hydrolase